MIVWLLVLLAIVALGVLLWRSERHNQQIHGKGSGLFIGNPESPRTPDEWVDALLAKGRDLWGAGRGA